MKLKLDERGFPVPVSYQAHENIRGVIWWTVIFMGAGFLALNAFHPNNDVNIAVDILIGVMSTMALSFYIFTAIKAVWTGSRAHVDYLIVGIALSWLSQDGQAWLRVISRLSGFDPAFVNSELFAPIKLLSVVAAVLHVVPKGAANGVVPRGNSAAVAASFVVAAVIATLVLTFKPNPKPYIDMMPGWSRDFFQTGGRAVPGASPS